jgi:hypothetical protein
MARRKTKQFDLYNPRFQAAFHGCVVQADALAASLECAWEDCASRACRDGRRCCGEGRAERCMVKMTPMREKLAQAMMLMLLRLDPRLASPLFFGPGSSDTYWKPVGETRIALARGSPPVRQTWMGEHLALPLAGCPKDGRDRGSARRFGERSSCASK